MIPALLVALPACTGLLCLLVPNPRTWEKLNLAGAIGACFLAGLIAEGVRRQGAVITGFFRADALSALIILLTAFVAFVSTVYAIGYFRRDLADGRITVRQLRYYYVLTPWFVSAMFLVPLTDSLGVMWVATESTTLASVLLVTFYNQKTSFEAGWKYIVIGSVGVALALFGTIVTYSSAIGVLGTAAHAGMNWSALLRIADHLDPRAMRLGFVLVLLGYGTKAGLVPMHTWKPDAYAEAPVPVAALLGAGFINCAVYGIIRFSALADKCLGHDFPGTLLIIFGIGSMLVAAPFVIVQRNFRRILAYSSIDHAGIIIAALGFGGRLGLTAALLHMVFHAITKPLLFFCAGNVQQHFGTAFFRKVRGVLKLQPWTGGLFLVGTLAVTGTPPFSLFQSEFLALSAAVAQAQIWAAVLFVIGVVTIFAGFLIQMSKLALGEPFSGVMHERECPWKLGAMLLVGVPLLSLSVALPSPLFDLVQAAVQLLRGGLA